MLRNLQEGPNPVEVQETAFSVDVLGRYICNTYDEAVNNGGFPFDAIVIGAGMHGAYIAEKIHRRGQGNFRVLVLEAGSFLVSEHVQNISRIGLNAAGPITVDPGVPRERVWGLPWRSNHHLQNGYAAGPAVFPALGSANPSLTALTLARRTACAIVQNAFPAPEPGALSLLTPTLDGWQMAGFGRFNVIGNGTVESEGGIGLLWYTKEEFVDFSLTVQWRSINIFDNSGVFIRFPALGNTDPANDWKLAVDQGYEI
jgi:hypothetical protein